MSGISNCKDKPGSYASWAIFDIKRPDMLLMLPPTSKIQCSDMVNLIYDMKLMGAYRDMILKGKHRLVFYLDESLDGEEVRAKYKLKWAKTGSSLQNLLLAGGGLAIGGYVGYKRGQSSKMKKYLPDPVTHQPICKDIWDVIAYIMDEVDKIDLSGDDMHLSVAMSLESSIKAFENEENEEERRKLGARAKKGKNSLFRFP